ncbi:YigZ family protein [Prevotella sp. 885]|nr:YigZ family protein [Prevotella sp. 885]
MNITDEYFTIKDNISEGFYSEKRSKFLAFAFHVTTEEEIKEIVSEYRKKYYDARHVCWAYMLGAQRTEFRANDDGEPSSTAGKPILGQINKNELTDILIIVVRYYGGVNLGTSGLIVAYRTAAAEAIANAEVIKLYDEEVVTYDFPYVMMNDVMKIIKDMSPRIVSQTYDNTCEIQLSIRKSQAPLLKSRLEKLSFKDE